MTTGLENENPWVAVPVEDSCFVDKIQIKTKVPNQLGHFKVM